MQKNDAIILGTRPEVIKFYPLIKKANFFIIHTGQQKELSEDMYNLFGITPDIDLKLMTDNQSLSEIVSKCIVSLDKVVRENKFERIWVYGDTSSCLAGALVATMNKIKLIHVEAGLRSYDKNNPFPEETFRTVVDNMADIMFAPTLNSVRNLILEKHLGKVYLTGNTVVDALMMFKEKLPKERPIKEKYVLATVHRRESFGNEIKEIFKALKELSKTVKVILPAHPNPNVQKALKEIGLETVKPMDYFTFLWHLRDCEYVMSDSGGIQEEAPSFNKKVIILRKTTERPEVIQAGYGVLIEKLEKENILYKTKEFICKQNYFEGNPFGDGFASEKMLNIIKKL